MKNVSEQQKETVTLKMSEMNDIFTSLLQLDTYTKIIKDAGVETAVEVPYTFTENFRWWKASSLAKLKVIHGIYQQRRNEIIKELSDDGRIVPQERMAEFNERMQVVDKFEETLDIVQISRNDLNISINQAISGPVITALIPLMYDM